LICQFWQNELFQVAVGAFWEKTVQGIKVGFDHGLPMAVTFVLAAEASVEFGFQTP